MSDKLDLTALDLPVTAPLETKMTVATLAQQVLAIESRTGVVDAYIQLAVRRYNEAAAALLMRAFALASIPNMHVMQYLCDASMTYEQLNKSISTVQWPFNAPPLVQRMQRINQLLQQTGLNSQLDLKKLADELYNSALQDRLAGVHQVNILSDPDIESQMSGPLEDFMKDYLIRRHKDGTPK